MQLGNGPFLHGSISTTLLNNCRRTVLKDIFDYLYALLQYAYTYFRPIMGKRTFKETYKLSCVDRELAEALHLDRLARLDVKQRRRICKAKTRGFISNHVRTSSPVKGHAHTNYYRFNLCAIFAPPCRQCQLRMLLSAVALETLAGKASSDATKAFQSLTMRVFLVDLPKPHVDCKHGARMKKVDFERAYDDDLLLEQACPTACSLVRSFSLRRWAAGSCYFLRSQWGGFRRSLIFFSSQQAPTLLPPICGPPSGEYGA